MPWQKMLFRGEPVWVQVGEDGRPVLDSDGRAEMKYREHDTKSYRPGPGNLMPAGAATDSGPTSFGPATSSRGPAPALKQSARTSRAGAPTRSAGTGASASGGPGARPGSRPSSPDGGTLDVWTDGACSGNPGPMGIGVVVLDGAQREELGEHLGVGTNNIAELVAIERGLDLAVKRISSGTRRVRVHSDSGYAIGLLSKSWKAKANVDLVARIRRKLAAFPATVEFVKVAGHAGIPENERCDELAREAVDSHRSRR